MPSAPRARGLRPLERTGLRREAQYLATKMGRDGLFPRLCLASVFCLGLACRSAVAPDNCEADVEGDLKASVELRFFRGLGIKDSAVSDQARRLQRYFSRFGLTFRTSQPTREIDLRYAMRGSAEEIEAARRASAALSRSDAATNAAVGSVVFPEMKRFVASHAAPVNVPTVLVVVLQQIVSPELSEAMYGTRNAPTLGYGISEAFLSRADPDGSSETLREMLNLTSSFTPVLFVADATNENRPINWDNLVGHEMGHALGLRHSTAPRNVMAPGGLAGCTRSLNADQLNAIGATLAEKR